MQQESKEEKKKLINKTDNDDHTAGDQPSFVSVDKKDSDSKKNCKKYTIIGVVAAVAIALIVTLSVTLTGNDDSAPTPLRPDNPPGPAPIPTPIDIPVFVNNYTASAATNTQDTYSGFIISEEYQAEAHAQSLRLLQQGIVGAPTAYGINPSALPVGVNNEYIKNVSFMFAMTNFKVGYLIMTDATKERYYVPADAVYTHATNPTMRLEMLGFQLFNDPFSFSFTDVADPDNVYIHTKDSSLVFMDKYIQMDFQLPSQRVYGLGERVREFALGQGTWTMWAKGQDSPYDDGTGGKQVYGVHPFVLVQGKKAGDFFGIYFRNSNAQSPLLRFNTDGSSTLSYITTGGQLEVFFFIHGSAKSIIQAYQNTVGNPNLPPFWSLGWQQASWKYPDQATVEQVISNYAEAEMPLEVMWLDIPYLNQYADFSVDETAFPDLPGLTTALHNNNQKIVVILDAGLSADSTTNEYYTEAQTLNILIQSTVNPDGEYEGALVMKVWPDHTVFIDWFNPDAQTLWNEGLANLRTLVPYDGLWLDMNEATGFCNGECPNYDADSEATIVEMLLKKLNEQEEMKPKNLESTTDTSWFYSFPDQSVESTYYLPFIPGYNFGGNLDTMTLSLNATNPSIGETQYNLHSLYGLMMAKATFNFLTSASLQSNANSDDRPFILSRSTFAGSGQYTSHWLGDNWRSWEYMKYSVAGIMNMNMFGIPHAGADVCGFFGEKRDDEMCARWIQLSTFYPFARAHQNLTWNGEPSENSEPYLLQGDWHEMAKASLYDRYQYLRHQYTCLFEASQWGGSCFDPLFYYFPSDNDCFNDIESSFIVGGALKVSPIFAAGVETFTSYFPAGQWVNLADFSEIITGPTTATLKSRNTVNVHLMPGAIVPFQNNSDFSMKTTQDLLDSGLVSLIINRDASDFAYGTLLLDSGLSRKEIFNSDYEYLQFQYSAKSINKLFAAGTKDTEADSYTLDQIILTNAEDFADTDFQCYVTRDFQVVNMTSLYNETDKTLHISTADTNTPINFDDFKMIYFGNTLEDANLCSPTSYQYRISDGAFNLTDSKTQFLIENQAGVLPTLQVVLQMTQPHIVNIQWSFFEQPDGERIPFEVPADVVDPVINPRGTSLNSYIDITADPFTITIFSLTGETVMEFNSMLFDTNLNIIDVVLHQDPAKFKGIMGLGQQAMADLWFEDGVYSLWSLDTANPAENGQIPGKNMYGTHPFYLSRAGDQNWIGVYTNLAAAQDWYIKNEAAEGTVNIRTVAIGGVADIYVILGFNPKQVGADYQSYIVGKPVLIPVFALGWNQCKWGYATTQDLQDNINGYADNNIPLDTQWSDIDYLYSYRDFTYDDVNFEGLPALIDALHANGQHYVPIIDAGIAQRPWSVDSTYAQYDSAVEADIFVKVSATNKEDFVGYVWPNEANYPDWYNPATSKWYTDSLAALYKDLEFDGLWLDMNEASNFCNGACSQSQIVSPSIKSQLKYIPSNRQLETKAIALDAWHYGDVLEMDTHSLYGTQEVIAAAAYFQSTNRRPFIIERSSFAGMGKYGSLWLGDNWSSSESLKFSVGGTMMMNLFGIPLAGADICGFIGDTDAELCARWTVAGAFYPFSRNHNNYGQIPQEPWAPNFAKNEYEEGTTYMSIMTDGIRNKYHLIRYYYTHFFSMSTFGTGPFYNPLFFEFPDDIKAYDEPWNNIMLGPALKLSVNTAELNVNTTSFYFPAGMWCNVFNPSLKCFTSPAGGMTQDLPSKAYDFYIHLYQGYIVPLQDATLLGIMNTMQLQDYPIDLHILGKADSLGYAWYAAGIYINDDGETLEITGNFNQYSIIAFADAADPDLITINITQTYSAYHYDDTMDTGCSGVNKNDYLGQIFIYNAAGFQSEESTYTVTATLMNKDIIPLGEGVGTYDANADQIILTKPANICLSLVQSITFTPDTRRRI